MGGKHSNNMENYWLKKEGEKQNALKMDKENSYKDAEYVKMLGSWEKNHLPKINTKAGQ